MFKLWGWQKCSIISIGLLMFGLVVFCVSSSYGFLIGKLISVIMAACGTYIQLKFGRNTGTIARCSISEKS